MLRIGTISVYQIIASLTAACTISMIPLYRKYLSGVETERMRCFLEAVRPRQWPKNLLVYGAFAFSANQSWSLTDPYEALWLLGRATVGALAFCLLSGSLYLFNDVADASDDRRHPYKRFRPIASGRLNMATALIGGAILGVLGLGLGGILGGWFVLVGGLYFSLSLLYTYLLKQIVIVDVVGLSAGFVLRAIAGAVAIDVPVSFWLYLCTGLGAMMVVLSKRRAELLKSAVEQPTTRRVLGQYSRSLLDRLQAFAALTALGAYIGYSLTAPTLPSGFIMALTIPFVTGGLARYWYLSQIEGLGEKPEELFLSDWPLSMMVGGWLLAVVVILLLYGA